MRGEEIDWAGLRAAAVAIGIRAAARQAARDLPPDEQERFIQRAMKRCSREKWLVKAQQHKANAVAISPTRCHSNRLWYARPDAVANAIEYAQGRSRSHRAVIRVYDAAGNVI